MKHTTKIQLFLFLLLIVQQNAIAIAGLGRWSFSTFKKRLYGLVTLSIFSQPELSPAAQEILDWANRSVKKKKEAKLMNRTRAYELLTELEKKYNTFVNDATLKQDLQTQEILLLKQLNNSLQMETAKHKIEIERHKKTINEIVALVQKRKLEKAERDVIRLKQTANNLSLDLL